MLKIKDNIPIKVVKKFGFEYRAEEKAYCKEIENSDERIEIVMTNDEYHHQIRLYINDEYYECWTSENSFDIIYDLIKADLVEKVSEDKDQ